MIFTLVSFSGILHIVTIVGTAGFVLGVRHNGIGDSCSDHERGVLLGWPNASLNDYTFPLDFIYAMSIRTSLTGVLELNGKHPLSYHIRQVVLLAGVLGGARLGVRCRRLLHFRTGGGPVLGRGLASSRGDVDACGN